MDRREQNRMAFEDTRKCCSEGVLKKSIGNSCKEQRVIKENDDVPSATIRKDYGKTKVIVSDKRSFEAAKEYNGKKICVLNFASASNPGGGVVHGSNAQEESLCRCSTLYFCLNVKLNWDAFYAPHRVLQNPLYNNDCIYTPNITVFKSDVAIPELLPESEWYSVNVLSAAAPNLRERPSNSMNPCAGKKRVVLKDSELLELHLSRGRWMLDIAKAKGNEVLILGAFGCGAFQNPPHVVAEAYKRLMGEYDGVFELVEFAVYCPPRDSSNYDVFARVLRGM